MRIRGALVLGLAATALVVLSACDDGEPAVPPLRPAPTAPAAEESDTGLAVSVEVSDASVAVGEEIVLRVTVANTGDAPARVSIPRIDRYCATVRVRIGTAEPYLIEHLYADLAPDGMKWTAPNAQELPPGGEVTADLSLTATQPGEHHLTLSYRSAMNADAVTPDPLKVVVSADGEKRHLGARIDTAFGPVTVRLRPDLAPVTVESFATLARRGFFDGLTLHRIVAGFMAQGGDPKGDGSGGPGYYLPLEPNRKLLHRRGVLSMARTNIRDTAGSQFFLMFATRPSLDPGFRGGDGYTTFGELVEGEDTLAKIEAVETAIAPAIQRQIEARNIPAAQVEEMIRRGQIEKSTPVDRVEITAVKLLTLE